MGEKSVRDGLEENGKGKKQGPHLRGRGGHDTMQAERWWSVDVAPESDSSSF